MIPARYLRIALVIAGATATAATAATVTGSVVAGDAAEVGAQVVMFAPAPELMALTEVERTPDLRVMFEGRRIVPAVNPQQLFSVTIRTVDFPPEAGDETVLSAGHAVNSYLVFFAPNDFVRQGRRDLSIGGRLYFPRAIIGYMADDKTITAATWAQIGGINYNGITGLRGSDAFAFSGVEADYFLRTLDTAPRALRVFTTVPEPGSWAMLIGGFALIGATQRRRRSVVA